VRDSDRGLGIVLGLITACYGGLIAAMLVADATYAPPGGLFDALTSREIRFAIWLSLATCTASAVLSLLVAVPVGYCMSRMRFPGASLVDAILDIPIVLPPLVIGLSLLILFQMPIPGIGCKLDQVLPLTYSVGGVILAQSVVACAFAVRTMRTSFDQLDPRPEQVALTLGATRAQAFLHIAIPSVRRGMVTAATLAWARSMGEFGPILVFAGATRMKTEVLPTTVFLELSVGNLEAAVAVSLLMVICSVAVLMIVRRWGEGRR
jgi:molybdate transport system permease protein